MTASSRSTERPRPTAGSRPRGLLAAAVLALAAHAALAALLFGGGAGDKGLAADGTVAVTDIVFVAAPAPRPATAAPVAALAAPAPAPALAEPAARAQVAEPAAAPIAPPQPAVKPTIAAAAARPSPTAARGSAQAQGVGGAAQAAAAPPSAAPGPAGGRAAAGVQYERRLLEALYAHLVYPRLARARGQQGEARLYLLIGRDGEMLAHRLDASSGFAALDAAALDTARRAAPLPPLPRDFPDDRLALVVPISFALR
jgi:protein TonB